MQFFLCTAGEFKQEKWGRQGPSTHLAASAGALGASIIKGREKGRSKRTNKRETGRRGLLMHRTTKDLNRNARGRGSLRQKGATATSHITCTEEQGRGETQHSTETQTGSQGGTDRDRFSSSEGTEGWAQEHMRLLCQQGWTIGRGGVGGGVAPKEGLGEGDGKGRRRWGEASPLSVGRCRCRMLGKTLREGAFVLVACRFAGLTRAGVGRVFVGCDGGRCGAAG